MTDKLAFYPKPVTTYIHTNIHLHACTYLVSHSPHICYY